MPIKIKGVTTGSVSLEAPATGSDVTLTLPGVNGELLPLGGGKILQIVRATDGTQRSTTSSSYVDANISVTITPQKDDSAILLIWHCRMSSPSGEFIFNRITDSSNNPISGTEENGIGTGSTSVPVVAIAYATPATTSATTFKGRFRITGGGNAGLIRNDVNIGQLYAIEVSA